MTKPICAQAFPYAVDVKKDQKYFWCTCGLSQKQPFCDGKHKGSEMKSQCYTAPVSEKVLFCGCKKTKTPPLCDGTHSFIEE